MDDADQPKSSEDDTDQPKPNGVKLLDENNAQWMTIQNRFSKLFTSKDCIYDVEGEIRVIEDCSQYMPETTSYFSARFFIGDLLSCENFNEKSFKCKNISFTNVIICGTVISIDVFDGKFYFKVDDGTGSIQCIGNFEKQQQLRKDVEKCLHDTRDMIRENEDDILVQGSFILQKLTLKRLMPANVIKYFNPGDRIKVNGTLTHFQNVRRIFTASVKKVSCVENIDYFESLLKLYENDYNSVTDNKFDDI